jgi:hypothetical protein
MRLRIPVCAWPGTSGRAADWPRGLIAGFLLLAGAPVVASAASARPDLEEPQWRDSAPYFPARARPGTDADGRASSGRDRRSRDGEDEDDDEGTAARPRRPSLRREHRDARRPRERAHPPARSAARGARTRQARRPAPPPSAQGARQARTGKRRAPPRTRTAALPPATAVPMGERSVVATHPLLPDPAPPGGQASAADAPPAHEAAAPRCTGAHSSAFALAVASFARDFDTSQPAMVEGAWPHCRGALNPRSNWQLVSLGPARLPAPDPSRSRSLSGGSIRWIASAGCLAPRLRAVLARVAANFGPVTVNSTCRSRRHNARVGGATRSYHLTGNAVDFRVRSNFRGVLSFLLRQRAVGGYKHYGRGVFHIDTGPRRTWGPRRTRHARHTRHQRHARDMRQARRW